MKTNTEYRNPQRKMPHAGWHCSSCFRSTTELAQKLTSFAHKEYSGEHYTGLNVATLRICIGYDLFARGNYGVYQRTFPIEAPQYVLDHKEEYMHLLDRANTEACKVFRKRGRSFLPVLVFRCDLPFSNCNTLAVHVPVRSHSKLQRTSSCYSTRTRCS